MQKMSLRLVFGLHGFVYSSVLVGLMLGFPGHTWAAAPETASGATSSNAASNGALAKGANANGAGSPAVLSAQGQLQRFVKQSPWAQGEFEQTVLNPQGALVQRGSGTFAFARPGRFRWDTQKPYPQLVVSDGKTLTVFDPDLQQATQKPLAQAARGTSGEGAKLQAALEGTPAALLFGAVNVQAVFELQEEGTHDGLQWLKAKPRSAENLFTSMRIGFNAQGLPQRLDIEDALGQSTRLVLKGWRFDKPKAGAFEFAVPAGVDVVPVQ